MSMFDGILGQVAQNVDINNLAQKVGLAPEQVESAVRRWQARTPARAIRLRLPHRRQDCPPKSSARS